MKWFKCLGNPKEIITRRKNQTILITDNIHALVDDFYNRFFDVSIVKVSIGKDGKPVIGLNTYHEDNDTILILIDSKVFPINVTGIKDFVAYELEIVNTDKKFILVLLINYNRALVNEEVRGFLLHEVEKNQYNTYIRLYETGFCDISFELWFNGRLFLDSANVFSLIKDMETSLKDIPMNKTLKAYIDKFKPRRFLFIGYYGTGKTFAAKKLADLYNLVPIKINLPFIYNHKFGITEKNLVELFDLIMNGLIRVHNDKKFLLFFDEFDKVLGTSGNCDSDICQLMKRLAGLFAEWTSDLSNDNLWIAYAVNNIELLDEMVIRSKRVDLIVNFPIVKVTPKNIKKVIEILDMNTGKTQLAKMLVSELLKNGIDFLTLSDIDMLVKGLRKCENENDIELLLKGINLTGKLVKLIDKSGMDTILEDRNDILKFYDI